jgi:aspartate dehydrogenase
MSKRNVGLIGCGTIGTHIALAIDSGNIANASLTSLFDIACNNADSLKSMLRRNNPEIYVDFDTFIDSSVNIVVEAASQQATKKFGRAIVEKGKDLMIMSVGALVDGVFLTELLDIIETKDGRNKIYIPSGAIAGIDAIRSVRHVIDSIILNTTKNPKALAGAPFFATSNIRLDTITNITTIYEGSAAEAVKLFPANVNVAAVLSLAGIGADKTRVKIVADPNTNTNNHEILATGSFGEIKIAVNNTTAPGNPKTSFLAVLSAIECLRSICNDGLKIGS